MERNWEAEAVEAKVSEDERWEYAHWQWEREHEGEWDNYVPDEPIAELTTCEHCGAQETPDNLIDPLSLWCQTCLD